MVYCCRIEYDPELLQRALALCQQQRRQKAEKINNDKARAASITAGALLRYCLGSRADDVVTAENGRPYLKGGGYLSISHSGEYAVCAVHSKPVGVDIQKVVDISPRAVKRFCTDEEQQWLENCVDCRLGAVKLWALKESLLKASGESTAAVFKTSFKIQPDDSVNGPLGYAFSLSCDVKDYVIAACEKL